MGYPKWKSEQKIYLENDDCEISKLLIGTESYIQMFTAIKTKQTNQQTSKQTSKQKSYLVAYKFELKKRQNKEEILKKARPMHNPPPHTHTKKRKNYNNKNCLLIEEQEENYNGVMSVAMQAGREYKRSC